MSHGSDFAFKAPLGGHGYGRARMPLVRTRVGSLPAVVLGDAQRELWSEPAAPARVRASAGSASQDPSWGPRRWPRLPHVWGCRGQWPDSAHAGPPHQLPRGWRARTAAAIRSATSRRLARKAKSIALRPSRFFSSGSAPASSSSCTAWGVP